MNKKVLLFSVIIAVTLGAVCALLWQQLKSTQAREHAAAVAARAEAEARAVREDRIKEVERERARVDQQNKELADLTTVLRASEAKQASNVTALTRQLKSGLTNAAGGDAATEGMNIDFAKMMKDPAMKDMIRAQQKTLMKTMYGPMFKELGLSGDQQKKLSDLMTEAQMSNMENAGDLMGGTAESKTNAINAMTDQHQKMNADIKSLLGADKYAQYEDYQKSLADRMVLNQFQQESAGTETALKEDQLKALVQLMKEEREKTPPVISQDPSKTADTLAKMANTEAMEQQFQWQAEFDKRVFERAGKVLNAEQLKEFAEFQEQQSNMQKLGMKMAREMFGNKVDGPVKVFVAPAPTVR